MDPNYPHDIRQFRSMEELAAAGHVPVSPETAADLRERTPEERARFLANLRARLVDIARTSAIAQKVCDRLQAVVDPLIDKMDERGSDEENRPLVIGFLVGVRAWIGRFEGLEDALVPMLAECGVPREAYERVKIKAAADGIRAMELVRALVEEEEEAAKS